MFRYEVWVFDLWLESLVASRESRVAGLEVSARTPSIVIHNFG